MQDINTSSHVPVTVSTNQYVSKTVHNKHVKTNKCVKKLQWDKINKDKFQKTWINSLNGEQFESVTAEEKAELLSEMMRRAAAKSVPSITVNWKARNCVYLLKSENFWNYVKMPIRTGNLDKMTPM